MAQTKMKPAGKLIILILIGVAFFFGWQKFGDQLIPQGEKAGDISGMMSEGNSSTETKSGSDNECIEIGVVTWGGYAGGQYYNNGFKDNAGSRFRTEQNIWVNFHVMDDFAASRAAFKSGAMDLMWTTIDAFPTESGTYGENVKFLFQADWSRGGDAIVTTAGIDEVAGLFGKKIAVAPATPSHTFLLWMLDVGGLSVQDVEIIEVASAIDAAAAFKSGNVDAAVVWSPDDAGCIKAVAGAKVLINSKQATHIIADGFMVKESVFNQKRDQLTKLVEGWLTGSEEINTNSSAKKKASQILAAAFDGEGESDALGAINNVRLTTYGDNLDFFGLNPSYKNATAKSLYNKMSKVYRSLRLAENPLPYDQIVDVGFIRGLNLQGSVAKSEVTKTFKKATTREVKNSVAIATKPVRVSFPTGSSTLSENAKTIISFKFVDDSRAFPNARIRIEGNTDHTGNRPANISLSRKRAQSVVNYLVREQGMDANRFIVVGNGPDKPVCNDNSAGCLAKNRRTDFQILRQ